MRLVFQITNGGEIIAEIKLHPAEGDFGGPAIVDDDGTPHPIHDAGPLVESYPDPGPGEGPPSPP